MAPDPNAQFRLSPRKIRRLMLELGLTQTEVAKRMAPPGRKPRPEVISRLLRDATEDRNVQPRTIKRLMTALGAKMPEEICAGKRANGAPPKPKRKGSPKVTPRDIVYDLNRHYTIDELVKLQGVKPFDVKELFGKWPGDKDDGFEEMINESRRADLARERKRKR